MLGTAYEQKRLCSAVVPKIMGAKLPFVFLARFWGYICYVGVLLVALEAANLEPNVTSQMFGAT